MFYDLHREIATRNSGDPNAWANLMTWVSFHNTSLLNATLACYLHLLPENPDVATTHILHVSLLYIDDPALPAERRFELRSTQLVHKDDPALAPAPGQTYADLVFPSRAAAASMGRMEMGDDYWGTGVYLLMVKFRRDNKGSVPFWKHFGIDKDRARATPACAHPFDTLKHNMHEGIKPKFCCGPVPGMPTCCCGGWTHEKVRW